MSHAKAKAKKLERYLTVPEQMSGIFLKDGKIAILSDRTGTSQVWEYDTDDGFLVQRTNLKNRVWRIMPGPTRDGIFFASDMDGNENEQIYYLGEGGEPQRLTHGDMARYFFAGATKDLQCVRLASNARDAAHFDIVQINTETQEVDLVIENNDHYNIPRCLSPDGRYMLTNKLRAQSDNPLYLVDFETREQRPLIPDAPKAAYVNPVFASDSRTVYYTSDVDSEYLAVYRFVIGEDEVPTLIYELDYDVDQLALSYDDRYLAMVVNVMGAASLEILDLETGRVKNTAQLPLGYVFSLDFAPDSLQLLFSFSSGTRPWGLWILDVAEDSLERLDFEDDTLADLNLVEPDFDTFSSFDGLDVPYWIYTPLGEGMGPYPTIVNVHGGPEGQAWPVYDGVPVLHQPWLLRCGTQCRGSTGLARAIIT